ncbi:hypothetical protein OG205_24515 [Lentzea sp. NBC_00516]|uniref:hypothetical protein n=1 Tax=Lentzea sp. NBC_00516 TaxID=2903582 RepID=UPI002E80D5FF|nr:hypothetical protein [Lentzea sp. NBC_00516]WUD21304.1 hypothetical protein OG205_24515 [Lentzea sp. NBC_00516]
MIIALSESCPLFAPANEVHLHRFLLTIAWRWHAIADPSPNDLKKLLPPHVWSLYGSLLAREYGNLVNSSQSWVRHSNCGNCDPEKLATFYSLPTLVVVENAQTDGGWLKAVADRLRPAVARRFSGKNAMISVSQAGGIGEIPKEVRRLAERYIAARPHESVPLRVVALADSDAQEPGKVSDSAKEVEKAADAIGATSHILQKRTIENYVPDDALLKYSDQRRERRGAVEQIVSLTGPARDHYPLKTGIDKAHMSTIYPSDLKLELGVGDFIQDFLANFYHTMSASELRGRDGIGELDDLMEKLERNL